VLAVNPDNWCFYQREVAIYVVSKLDTPIDSFNIDHDVALFSLLADASA
jgi:hypothetical protein